MDERDTMRPGQSQALTCPLPERRDVGGLYRWASAALTELGVDAPGHEALLLCTHCLGISGRADIIAHGDRLPAQTDVRALVRCVAQRKERPLQYILGEWEFCSMTLAVGEGVLVPRDDTAALVETVTEAAARLGDSAAVRMIDLCAGSGAVGLACARALPGAHVVCAELSGDAMPYLEENVRRFGGGRVFIRRADVLNAPDEDVFPPESPFDIICSNPPYIRTDDIPGLAREVRQEPVMALDGGADGLDFYRAISEKWRRLLKDGGLMAFEIGAGMENDVGEIMRAAGFSDIRLKKDLNGHNRTIIGTHNK